MIPATLLRTILKLGKTPLQDKEIDKFLQLMQSVIDNEGMVDYTEMAHR